MTQYRTNNPLGSMAPKDLYDNAQNVDNWSNGDEPFYEDRFGVLRRSFSGMNFEFEAAQTGREGQFDSAQDNREQRFQSFLISSGYEDNGAYAAGVVLEERNQYVTVPGSVTGGAAGMYRPSAVAAMPLTLTGDWAEDSVNLVYMADATLRQEIGNSSDPEAGAALVGYNGGNVADALQAVESKVIGNRRTVLASSVATRDTPNTSQAAALQVAWDAAALAGDTFVFDGVFWVAATDRTYQDTVVRPVGLQVPSNSRTLFLPGAAIKVIPNALGLAYVLNFYLAENFEMWNPVVYGDLGSHTGTDGESSHCYNITNCKNGNVYNPRAYDAWGDGIYMGTEYYGLTNKQLENVFVHNPVAKNCGRNCISVTSGKNSGIRGPVIVSDAVRTAPMAGIDIEPEGVGECAPVLDNFIVEGPIIASGCTYAAAVYLFPALQGVVRLKVGDVRATNCVLGLVCQSFVTNNGQVQIGDVHAAGLQFNPVKVQWSQYVLELVIGDVFAFNTAQTFPLDARYSSTIAIDIDAENQPAVPIGNVTVGNIHLGQTEQYAAFSPFYFQDNTVAGGRTLDKFRVGTIYGKASVDYFYANGVVTENFKFSMRHTAVGYNINRRPLLFSEVDVVASGFDFIVTIGSDYRTPLRINKIDATNAPIKVAIPSGVNTYPFTKGGTGAIQTTVPGASVSFRARPSGGHLFQDSIVPAHWTAV